MEFFHKRSISIADSETLKGYLRNLSTAYFQAHASELPFINNLLKHEESMFQFENVVWLYKESYFMMLDPKLREQAHELNLFCLGLVNNTPVQERNFSLFKRSWEKVQKFIELFRAIEENTRDPALYEREIKVHLYEKLDQKIVKMRNIE